MTFEEFQYLLYSGLEEDHLTAIRHAITLLSNKWRLLILFDLSTTDSMRFNQLKKSLDGITSRQLTIELEKLQKDQFIKRISSKENGYSVSYLLTEKGRDLIYIFYDYLNWGSSY